MSKYQAAIETYDGQTMVSPGYFDTAWQGWAYLSVHYMPSGTVPSDWPTDGCQDYYASNGDIYIVERVR